MDYSIQIDTISMELSISYFKGLLVKISIYWYISVHEDFFFYLITNNVDPDKMLPYAAFDLGLSLFAKVPVYLEWMKRVKQPLLKKTINANLVPIPPGEVRAKLRASSSIEA